MPKEKTPLEIAGCHAVGFASACSRRAESMPPAAGNRTLRIHAAGIQLNLGFDSK